MKHTQKIRNIIVSLVIVIVGTAAGYLQLDSQQATMGQPAETKAAGKAADALNELAVKGRAPKTGYSRAQFGDGWAVKNGCDTRNSILQRDLKDASLDGVCKVMSGTLEDPYTGRTIAFKRGTSTSAAVQIDHVVALSDTWQSGAQQLSPQKREQMANDSLELLAVDGPTNQQKSDGDAATWLPSNKAFRCQYVSRQIAVKKKYSLWVKPAEKDAIVRILATCPGQSLPN